MTEKTVPNPEFLDGKTPTIKAGGIEWPVPMLGPEQNEMVTIPILICMPKIAQAQRDEKGNIPIQELGRILDLPTVQSLNDITFWAMRRAHPLLSRAEFNTLPVNTLETIANLSIIARQSGLFKEGTGATGGK